MRAPPSAPPMWAPLPIRCSMPPWSQGAVRSRQYSPAATRSRASAPIAMIASLEASAPRRISTTKIAASRTSVASVTGGRRPMRRSKSTLRERSMSGVMRSGGSGTALTSAALPCIEHDAERHGDPPIERARRVCGEIEHIAVQQRELPIELTEDLRVRATDEDEVRAKESEEGAHDPPEQREHDRVLDRQGQQHALGSRGVPALADDVVKIRLLQDREALARRRLDRVRPGQERDALILEHPQERLAPRGVAVDRHMAARPQRHPDHQVE